MELNNIKGITFAPFANKGVLSKKDAFKSLDALRERTPANFIMLVPNGLQATAHSEIIRYDTEATMSDSELVQIIRYAKRLGFNVGLKPTVNCKDGTWRAYISFFEDDIPNEPNWKNWFESYTEFQLHYAEIAKAEGVDLFCCGCEMVMTETHEDEWRMLIRKLRRVYNGILTYNADKYQEDHVKWWDALDAISSSGYYPLGVWDKELARIKGVVDKYNLPFFFSEVGCMSMTGSSSMPHDWSRRSPANAKEQERWYEAMFFAVTRNPWIIGEVLWCWSATPYALKKAAVDWGYDIFGKPAENTVVRYFSK